ncbi:unnamed protein product [Notodromas monacha]|uniref:Uncharacterized protein n=1 Tax=Notodromas monacha TaxID=399045 RepID=A0A7R9BTX7_9CRUS|nr:unnamed protein product [Notodromas monacha]CAG0921684.1 unnamed protein product [Notodromas monacha]
MVGKGRRRLLDRDSISVLPSSSSKNARGSSSSGVAECLLGLPVHPDMHDLSSNHSPDEQHILARAANKVGNSDAGQIVGQEVELQVNVPEKLTVELHDG